MGLKMGLKNHNQTLGDSTEKPISGMFCGRTLMVYRGALGKCPCSNPGTRKANRKIRINETGKYGYPILEPLQPDARVSSSDHHFS
jgi:hypothetical protein